MWQVCPLCKGSGKQNDINCPVCEGMRIINELSGHPPRKKESFTRFDTLTLQNPKNPE